MSEITRTIQIQLTSVVDSKDVGEEGITLPAEDVEKNIRAMFDDADQILVDVKDFIREGDD